MFPIFYGLNLGLFCSKFNTKPKLIRSFFPDIKSKAREAICLNRQLLPENDLLLLKGAILLRQITKIHFHSSAISLSLKRLRYVR